MSVWGWVFLAYVSALVPVSALWWRAGKSAGWDEGYDAGRTAAWYEFGERVRGAVHVRDPFGLCSCGSDHGIPARAWDDLDGVVS